MIEPTPELSSDLDWMLQSGQANREMLIEALVEEFFQPAYRLAAAYLGHSAAAWKTTIRIFSTAITSVYRYRSDLGVTNWFFTIAIEILRNSAEPVPVGRSSNAGQSIAFDETDNASPAPANELEAELWRSVDTLPTKIRLPFLLKYLLEWEPKDIARLLRQNEASIDALLVQAGKAIRSSLGQNGNQGILPDSQADELTAGLRPSLQKRWPVLYLSLNDLEDLQQAIQENAKRQGSAAQLFSKVKEVFFIGGAILAVLAVVWGTNILLPEPEATEIPITRQVTRSGRGRPSSIVRTPRPQQVTPTPTPVPEDVFYQVEPGETLEEIALELGTSAEELQTLNRLAETVVKTGQNLLIPGKITPSFPYDATAVPELLTRAQEEQPLESSVDLQDFMRKHWTTWDTLWADAFISYFGPDGYHGPPLINRVQFWISSNQFLVLIGSPEGDPEEVIIRNGQKVYRADLSLSPWFASANFNRRLSSHFEGLSLLFDPSLNERNSDLADQFILVGEDVVAGRKALVVNQTNQLSQKMSRIWIDAETGLILRRQVYSDSDPQTTTIEVAIISVVYNPGFDQDLFDPAFPWRGGFAKDETGAPEPPADRPRTWFSPPENSQIGYTFPPEDFNPAQSRLTFQFPTYFEESDPEAKVDLFADQYFLGKVQFGNPWHTICARSPDGLLIAYARNVPSPLSWFNLSDLNKVYSPFPAVLTTHFAFSPDSKELAVFNQYGNLGSIDILELNSGQSRHLLHLSDAKSFVWSPKGDSLALIGRVNEPAFDESVMVVDVQSGAITYSRSIDYESGNIRADWPPLEWGVEFPVEMGSLEACAAPPTTP